MGIPAIWRLGRGANPPAVSRLADNPNSTARRNWRSRWESNPHLPDASGCSIAVELREYPRVRANFGRRSRTRFCCHCAEIGWANGRSEEHTSELQSRLHLVCRLLLEKKKKT